MEKVFDAIVVGSGPAGACAALDLARGGAQVCVVERASPPRYKTCGGGLVARAIERLPAGVSVPLEREFRQLEVNFLDRGLHFPVERPTTVVAMTMRSAFDHAILTAAQEAGAELMAPREAFGTEEQGGHVTLRTDRGMLRAAFVIAADGANSNIARHAGWYERPLLIPALEYEVYPSDAVYAKLADSARFDFGVGLRGYAWVFPKHGHLSTGILSMTRGAVKLQQHLAHYYHQVGLTGDERTEKHGFLIPVRPRAGGFQRGRVMLVGDAAGLADPVTAEGISNAIESGRMAASAILAGEGDAQRVRTAFERDMDTIAKELRFARLLASLIYDHPRISNWLFRRSGQRICEAMTEVFLGTKTYRDLLTNPLNYLRLSTGI